MDWLVSRLLFWMYIQLDDVCACVGLQQGASFVAPPTVAEYGLTYAQ